jgi:hypothetical protein
VCVCVFVCLCVCVNRTLVFSRCYPLDSPQNLVVNVLPLRPWRGRGVLRSCIASRMFRSPFDPSGKSSKHIVCRIALVVVAPLPSRAYRPQQALCDSIPSVALLPVSVDRQVPDHWSRFPSGAICRALGFPGKALVWPCKHPLKILSTGYQP